VIRIGLLIFLGSWLPLLVVGLLHPESNPIGLGLLAWVGSLGGIIVAAIRLLLRPIRRNTEA
jgi:hypothetical protein